jgi:hypothetical protein
VTSEIGEIDSKVGIWLSVLCGLTIGVIAYAIINTQTFMGYDFQAFWCGANVLLVHANPYLTQPLHACEAAHSPAFFIRYPNVTIPAPLPPYALAMFTPLALLPFAVARAIWWIVLAVATFAVGRGISKLTGMPPITAFAASALAVAGPAMIQGALSPLPIALTVLAALALAQRKWNVATVLLGVAMIEPHMVLPACAAVFLFVPQMRLRLILAGLCAVMLTVLAVGPQVALAYFTTVLPAHAVSEVNNLGQDSLASLLYHVGVPAQAAVHLGSLQYLLLAVGGLYLAGRLYKQYGDLSWLILLPAAFAVIGGPFIHLSEVAMVIPLACLIVMRRPTIAATLALILLAIPSESVINWALLAAPAALICGWFMARSQRHPPLLLSARLPVVMAVGIAIMGATVALHKIAAAGANAQLLPGFHIPDPGPMALSSVSWNAFNSLSFLSGSWWLDKTMTFVPLVVLVWLTCSEALAGTSHVVIRRSALTFRRGLEFPGVEPSKEPRS